MRENDFIYYRRRAAEERSAAEATSNLVAARAHKAMAERYAALAEAGPSKFRRKANWRTTARPSAPR